MKTFSLASLTGALIFTSSLAVAGPRPGPDFDQRHHHMHLRGSHVRPGLVVRGPIARVVPHCVMPPLSAVFTPRVQVVSPRYNVSPHQHATHVAPVPARAPAPVVSAPQVPANPQSGGGKPSKPNGQGPGGTKPTKPAR